MKKLNNYQLTHILLHVIQKHKLLSSGILLSVIGAVVCALLPPLVLEKAVNLLTEHTMIPFYLALLYFLLNALTGILDSLRESLLIVFGQKITHSLRSALCAKLSRLTADTFVKQEPGAVVSRFVGDVDTIELLFTSGIVSMFADACKVVSIFVIIFIKNPGLAIVLCILTPLLFIFTRYIQKHMLKAQLDNRVAIGKVTNHVPESIRCIRTIHALRKEKYMRKVYDQHINDSYTAVEKTNFYDAIYSPIILIINALVVAGVMLLSASGIPELQNFFGMSVGTAVAIIAYISSVFTPLESIGMEIQTIQSAIAGVKRIEEFLSLEERWETDSTLNILPNEKPCIELANVSFGYEKDKILFHDLSFKIKTGEQVTLTGRTGCGKSTVFKLLLGQYQPIEGRILIYGHDAMLLPDTIKRKFFGYVEQNFHMVQGTVLDQITLYDESITREMAEKSAKTVGLHETILSLELKYDTPCTPAIFSHGQWQLLSIARAIAAEPELLLLDEITANLDADTEQSVLNALQKASENRTVLSISHRLYQKTGGRQISIA